MGPAARAGLILAALPMLVAACSTPGTLGPAVVAASGAQTATALGEKFGLRVGQTAAIEATELRLTFQGVAEDSRCPVGVTCVWAGDAVVVVAVRTGADSTETIELHSNPSVATEAVIAQPDDEQQDENQPNGVDEYVVQLLALAPERREASTIEVDEYEATLVVDRQSE